jgi:ferredoxin
VTGQFAAIEAGLGGHGLIARGGFHPRPDDGVPPMPDGRPAGTLIPVGNAGPAMWRAFTKAPEFEDGRPDPLDRWSRRVIGALAATWRAEALFPFGGPPYWPFVAWAKRAAAVAESPLGILIHPDFGLWHAFRGALAFAGRIDLPARDARARPCDSCVGKPCLSACPVGAFTPQGYDVASCVKHISTSAGADCIDLGCRARRACPVGPGYAHEPAQARFHMGAFLRARRGDRLVP